MARGKYLMLFIIGLFMIGIVFAVEGPVECTNGICYTLPPGAISRTSIYGKTIPTDKVITISKSSPVIKGSIKNTQLENIKKAINIKTQQLKQRTSKLSVNVQNIVKDSRSKAKATSIRQAINSKTSPPSSIKK